MYDFEPPLVLPEQTDGLELNIVGRLVEASNATYLADVMLPQGVVRAVYKPVSGERPLWDFPSGTLSAREVAGYRFSRSAGFHVVPQTVPVDGPQGPGSLQVWIEHGTAPLVDVMAVKDLPAGWFPIIRGVDEQRRTVLLAHADDLRLRRLALFDVLANNADRKGAHILLDGVGRVVGVDQGLCFHEETKLRTVLWGWSGEELTPAERALVEAAAAAVPQLGDLLSAAELEALAGRCDEVLESGRFPEPGDAWPVIPWPPL